MAAVSAHSRELDDLSVRFGLMPMKNEKNIMFAQQNINIGSDEISKDDLINKLGLKPEDFTNQNFAGTYQKIMNYYYATKFRDKSGAETDVGNDGVAVEGELVDGRPEEKANVEG